MTNFEKYREEIEKLKCKYSFAIDLDGNVVHCNNLLCCKCKFQDFATCKNNKINWLFDEVEKKASEEEKVMVKYVGLAKCTRYRYVARDKNGDLFLYKEKPLIGNCGYIPRNGTYFFEVHKSLFSWIQYSDGVYDIETSQFINVE